jgi:hypothetical protein
MTEQHARPAAWTPRRRALVVAAIVVVVAITAALAITALVRSGGPDAAPTASPRPSASAGNEF